MPRVSFYTKEDDENFKYDIILDWVNEDDGYFGEIVLISDDDKLKLYSEHLTKETVKKMFNQLIDEAEIMDIDLNKKGYGEGKKDKRLEVLKYGEGIAQLVKCKKCGFFVFSTETIRDSEHDNWDRICKYCYNEMIYEKEFELEELKNKTQ